MYASNVHADTHIYAAPYVHAETHFVTEANKHANSCDRSADTIHTNRSTLPPWLDSRAVLCARWHVDTDPKADSDQHANGQGYGDANIHADADWSPSQAPCRHTPDHHANAYPHTETRHDADQPDNRVGVRPPLFRVGALPQPLH